jgi:hypothetical protein
MVPSVSADRKQVNWRIWMVGILVAIGALIGYVAPVIHRHRRDERRQRQD